MFQAVVPDLYLLDDPRESGLGGVVGRQHLAGQGLGDDGYHPGQAAEEGVRMS